MLLQQPKMMVLLIISTYCVSMMARTDLVPGEYVYSKEFYVLADASLEFCQDGRHLVARRYEGPVGYKKKNMVIQVESGFTIDMEDARVALLVQDTMVDAVVLTDPLLHYCDARYLLYRFSCPYLIGGKRIEEFRHHAQLRSIARSADNRYIAIGFVQPARILLFTFKPHHTVTETKYNDQ